MSAYQRPQAVHTVSVPYLWVKLFSAVLAGVLVGGLLLGFALRAWLHWSVADTMKRTQPQAESISERYRADMDKLRADMEKARKQQPTGE